MKWHFSELGLHKAGLAFDFLIPCASGSRPPREERRLSDLIRKAFCIGLSTLYYEKGEHKAVSMQGDHSEGWSCPHELKDGSFRSLQFEAGLRRYLTEEMLALKRWRSKLAPQSPYNQSQTW